MHPIFTKNNEVRSTVTCNVCTKFEFSRIHHLDAIVFTHIQSQSHTHTHTLIYTYMHTSLQKWYKWIHEISERTNMSKSESRIFSRLLFFPSITHVRIVKISVLTFIHLHSSLSILMFLVKFYNATGISKNVFLKKN